MSDLPVSGPNLIARLKRVEGQVRGIQQMVADERDCVELLTQLAAARSALETVAALVLRNYTHICATDITRADGGARLAQAVALWVGGGKVAD